MDRQTDDQTDSWVDKHTGRQIDRQYNINMSHPWEGGRDRIKFVRNRSRTP